MDLRGRTRIQEALDSNLLIAGGGKHWFSIEPHEYELTGGEQAGEDACDSFRYLDVHTHASPFRVLEALRSAHLLEVTGIPAPNTAPLLRLLDISNNSRTTTLSFEDIAED